MPHAAGHDWLGGSSMHKGANGWNAARAISCLPALTGDFGLPGGGLGPRHGAQSAGFRNLSAPERRLPGNYIPNQMPDITEALSKERLKVLLLLGTNMLSSFADAGRVADGLDKADMVVCVDLFMYETARRFADVVLPGTAWLEELGFKATNTHLYLMERALEREGETRPIFEILRSLARSLGLADFFPWGSVEEVLDGILDHPTTSNASVATLRAAGGFVPLRVPAIAYSDQKFDSPSGKIEFYSSQAERTGAATHAVHKVDKYPAQFLIPNPSNARERMPLNPFVGVERIRGNGTTDPASRAEAYRLADALAAMGHSALGLAALICYEWLQRPENVLAGKISWTDYRPSHHAAAVRIDHHKTRKKIWQPLEDEHGKLYPEIEAFAARVSRLGFRLHCSNRSAVPRAPRPEGEPLASIASSTHAHLIQKARAKAGLPKHVTLAACRHGGMTELGDAGLSGPQIMSLSAHETPDAARVYVKRTELQRVAAARKRRQFVDRGA
jgi:hypothetical protein